MKPGRKSVGRRPGVSEARASIVHAAQRLFAEKGYDRTTIRHIALSAHTDPALVMHYFGTKQELFLTVMLPLFEAPEMISRVVEGDQATIGQRYAHFIKDTLRNDEVVIFLTAVIRTASSEPKAAEMVREFVRLRLVGPLGDHIPGKDAHLKASLLGAQIIGLIFARYVVRSEPLDSAAPEEIERVLAPLLQAFFE